jgi:predicted ArsR family transcriptional regulator
VEEEHVLAVLSLLDDDVRWRLYHFARRNRDPITREDAARAVDISAKLAAFHLDKMVQGGLLQADFDAPGGLRRRVGRAPKRYRPSALEFSLSLPQRRYDLIGEILVDALGDANGTGAPTARQSAFERGQGIGTRRRQARRRRRSGTEQMTGEARALLEALGFEPADADGELVLRNCPFQALARRDPQLVCGINLAFIDGMLFGLGNRAVAAELARHEGFCCVRVRPLDV